MITKRNNNKRKAYPSDISKNRWKNLRKLLPVRETDPKRGGRPPADLKEVINAIFYVVKTGCPWRSLPHDFPSYSTVFGYFNRWSKDGTWQWIHSQFIKKVRKKQPPPLGLWCIKRPSAACIDSQSSKTTASGGEHRGFDGGKQIKGRKRFILTDTQGLLLAVWICAAGISGKQELCIYCATSNKLGVYATCVSVLSSSGWMGIPWPQFA